MIPTDLSRMNLHILGNSVVQDSRVLRTTGSLVEAELFDEVAIAGLSDGDGPEYMETGGRQIWRPKLRSRGLPKNLPAQGVKLLEWQHRIVRRFGGLPVSVVHCHDLIPLPIAATIARRTGAKLVYDAHELETEATGLSPRRQKLARRLEQRYMPRVNATITVSPSIVSWYQQAYPGVPVTLLRNIPEQLSLDAPPAPLRSTLGVPEDALLFLHVGGLQQGRSIPTLLDAFAQAGIRHHLAFLGDGPLRADVIAAAGRQRNVHWVAPVPPTEVVRHMAGADVGVSLIEDVSLSYQYCLPNKLFESLAAGVPVLSSDLPDQSELLRSVDGGWLIEPRIGPLVERLRTLDRETVARVAADLPARTRHLTWENESRALLDLYRGLLET
jgi:glycosyltransferase involved in cell wall biosynthesis